MLGGMARGKGASDTLTASASVVRDGPDRDRFKRLNSRKSRDADWQREAWQAYHCVDLATEALTPEGWRRGDEIVVGDTVLAYDHETGLTSWQPVEAMHWYDLDDEPVLRMRGRRHSSLTTFGHRWPVMAKRNAYSDRVPVWRTSADLIDASPDAHLIMLSAPCADLPTEQKYTDAFVELVAWAWTEGHLVKGRSLGISQSTRVNAPFAARIRSALTSLLGPSRDDLWACSHRNVAAWRETPQNEQGVARFNLNAVAAEPVWAVMPDKVPSNEFIRSLTLAQLGLFVDVSVMADGAKRTVGACTQRLSQAPKNARALAAFEMAAVLAGRSVTATDYQRNDATDERRVAVSERPWAKVADRTVESFTGPVWCPTVPSGGWVARREGTVFITGNSCGEVRFAARYIGNGLSRVMFYAGARPRPGQPAVQFTEKDLRKPENATVLDAFDRLRGRDGTLQSLLLDYGIQQFVAGESYLVGADRGKDEERWAFLSTTEHDRINKAAAADRKNAENADANDEPDNAVVIRCWTRDPEDRARADSSLRSVLDIVDALQTAQAMQTASDRSRLATAGILFLPSKAGLPKSVVDVNGAEVEQLDLLNDLLEVAGAVIDDPAAPQATVPILLEMDDDKIEKVKHLRFDRDVDKTLPVRVEAYIKRLAQGLDIAPEKLTGTAAINHWGAWAIDEQVVAVHIAPMAAQLAEDLTAGYLRPVLKAAGVANPDDYAIWFDLTELVEAPSRSDNAKWAYANGLLSRAATAKAVGFSEETIPKPDELNTTIAIMRAIAGSQPSGPVIGPDGKAITLPEPVANPADQTGPTSDGQDPAPTGKDAPKGPPPDGPPDRAETPPPPGRRRRAA